MIRNNSPFKGEDALIKERQGDVSGSAGILPASGDRRPRLSLFKR